MMVHSKECFDQEMKRSTRDLVNTQRACTTGATCMPSARFLASQMHAPKKWKSFLLLPQFQRLRSEEVLDRKLHSGSPAPVP